MPIRQPIAFLSYVRSDDDHDDGRISTFRKRLEGEVRMQTGQDFAIFQDRNDIAWGQNWDERIKHSLSDVTFLIPVITPSFFRSPACRSEFLTFSLKEKTLGLNRLILPLYYVLCDQFGADYVKGSDEIADIISQRNWTDWRKLRFKAFTDEAVAAALAEMATTIKTSIAELNLISAISEESRPLESLPTIRSADMPAIVSEENIPQLAGLETIDENAVVGETEYVVSEVNAEGHGPSDELPSSRPARYYAYTKRFDEVIDAGNFAEKSEILRLHRYITSFARAFNKIHGKSLSSALSQFRPKRDDPALAVSILIDNSGSMRGEKIVHTAAWCLLINEWLDRLRIANEFLGYTTRAWKGGRSRELWLASGKPSNPGRLNDLRHLVYKSFSSEIATAGPNFGMMAKEGLLKENIDGEALLWAASRLRSHSASQRLLFVISDGAPVDDSTLSVNPGNFLEKHLREVIDDLSEDIGLYAIGVGFDVSRYYPNSVVASREASDLGPRFFEALVNDDAFAAEFSASKPREHYRLTEEDEEL